MEKQTICAMLRVWINQRPGLEFGRRYFRREFGRSIANRWFN